MTARDLPRLTPEQADLLTVEGQHRMSPDTDERILRAAQGLRPTALVVDEAETLKVTPREVVVDPESGVVRIERADVEKVVVAAKIDAATKRPLDADLPIIPNRAMRRAAAKRGRRRGR